MKKVPLIFFSFLLLGIIFLPVKPVSPPTTLPPPSPLPTSTPTPVSWPAYQNEKYLYQFSYPPNWTLTEWDLEKTANLKNPPDGSILQQTIVSGADGRFEILIWNNKGNLPTRRWLTTFRHEDLILKQVPEEENTIFAKQSAIQFLQGQTNRNKPIEYIFLKRNNLIFEILMEKSYLELDYPLYEQILSSFQIL